MPLPEADRVLFRKAPLKQVIVQVRYPLLPRFAEPGFIAAFIEQLKERYPKVERREQRSVLLSAGEGVSVGASETLWRLGSRDGGYVAVLGENAVTLEINHHSRIDELTERFGTVLSVAKETLGLTDRGRVGLRYINEFRGEFPRNLQDWKPLLNDDFVGFAAGDVLDGVVDRMMQEVRVQRDDGTFAVRHGLLPTETEEGGTSAAPPVYLLDLDYYDTTERELVIDQTMQQVREYGDYMYRFFRWTLKDRLFSMLEPEK